MTDIYVGSSHSYHTIIDKTLKEWHDLFVVDVDYEILDSEDKYLFSNFVSSTGLNYGIHVYTMYNHHDYSWDYIFETEDDLIKMIMISS